MPPPGVRLVIDGAEMANVLRGPQGAVAHYFIRLADDTIAVAKDRVRDNPHRRWQPPNMTGKLARTIVKRPYESSEGFGMMVVAGIGLEPNYAYWVHEGNGPSGSRIFPKRKRVLAWVTSGERPTDAGGWQTARAAGIAVFFKSVRTSNPNPFLREALQDVMAARGR